jgi:hypothetical protein
VELVQETPTEPQEAEGQPRGADGKFLPKEAGVETPPEPVEASAEPVPPTEQAGLPKEDFAALKDERRKRQAMEAELAEMRTQFARMQAKPPEQAPDFWDNPDAAMQARLDQFGETLLQRFEQKQQVERIDASEAQARAKHADFDDAFHAFRQAVQANPALAQQMTKASDPAEFAYQKGKTALDLERVGSIDEMIKAERAKWEAEARAVVQPAAQPMFPSSTVTERSVGQRRGPEWSGPTPLGDILTP